MSILTGRVIAPAEAPSGQQTCLMSDMTPGSSAQIMEVCAETDPAAARRLFDLGFVPGAEVVVVRRAPMADPVIFRVAGCELALRRVQARCIRVSV